MFQLLDALVKQRLVSVYVHSRFILIGFDKDRIQFLCLGGKKGVTFLLYGDREGHCFIYRQECTAGPHGRQGSAGTAALVAGIDKSALCSG